MAIPPQTEFFYKGKWCPACDDALVDCLIMLKAERNVSTTEYPAWFLLNASDWIKNKAGVIFFALELKDRIAMLRKRYCIRSEPIWARLACVFGFHDVKVEGEKDVVIISDNTVELHEDEIVVNAFVGGEEEVNSPAVFPGPKVRRKLFEADTVAKDRESSTDPKVFFIDLTSDGMMRTREEKGRILYQPPKLFPNEGVGPSNAKSPRVSSCGSNSPMNLYPHI
ncbi:hypothetical protein SASPL_137607 [Salvia splendens]|uniref:Uncharacterized protein n=1 Tax=Salvia splendens TaxID=180675 RepID=A0A8X8WV57_SALSN|nr:hypothetical protein SASPL_137607 [Salvia splendens]